MRTAKSGTKQAPARVVEIVADCVVVVSTIIDVLDGVVLGFGKIGIRGWRKSTAHIQVKNVRAITTLQSITLYKFFNRSCKYFPPYPRKGSDSLNLFLVVLTTADEIFNVFNVFM